jgi:hypothetical protein
MALAVTSTFATACATAATTIGSASSPERSAQPEISAQPEAANQVAETKPQEKNFVLPAIEIVAMDALVNLAGRQLYSDPATFDVSLSSIKRNLRGRWVIDDDPFQVNQFLHPYQGAMYHDIARSSGLNYWQAAAYTFAGSALWEMAGETTPPSKNDQIASGIAGPFLGEPLFRTARLLLDRGRGRPGIWRVLAATAVAPPAGVNHLMFGDRFDPVAAETAAASDIRLQIGLTAPVADGLESGGAVEGGTASAGFSVDYGFPGKADYPHARPFDYFNLDAIATGNGLESLATRGLILGRDFSTGQGARGVWGLYGSYDYFAPDVFRVSSTALSFGTTTQWWVSDALTLHGTALAGTGYTATQSEIVSGDRHHHYGIAPQALVAVRLIAGRRASLDLTAREFFVSDIGGFETRERDVIFRGDASLAWRLFRQHAIAIKYVLSRREVTQPGLPRLTQSHATMGVFYTFLGSGGFGAVR